MIMLYLLLVLVVLAVVGVPLAMAIGGSCISYVAINSPNLISMLPQRIWSGSFSYVLVAMPLFIFMGELMNESGLTERLIDFCMYLVRPIRGGLGEVNVVASMIFGGISGSSVADTSCLGSVLIPEMEKRGYHPVLGKLDVRAMISTLVMSFPAVVMPIIMVLSISFGICTASEAGAVAVFYSLVLGFFLYRKLTVKAVISALRKTFVSSSSITVIIGFSTIFTWLMTMQQVPQTVAAMFLALNLPKWVMLLILDALILFLGTFIDVSPAILMLTPILLPIMRAIGVNDWQFGAIFIIGLAIGLVTPLVGMCLNVCNKINKMSILDIAKGALPFVTCNIVVLLATTFIPALSNWLPLLMNYQP